MAKEKGYKCRLTTLTSNTIARLAGNLGLSIVDANRYIRNIDKELRYGITIDRCNEIRRVINPSGIALIRGEEARRKYECRSKVQEIPQLEPTPIQEPQRQPKDSDGYEQPKDMKGLIVPIGTLLKVNPNSANSDVYRVVSFRSNTTVGIRQVDKNDHSKFIYHESGYNIAGLNRSLHLKQWTLVNENLEVKAKIDAYSNVVTKERFKRSDSNTQSGDRVYAHAGTYVIEVEGNRIPFSPGFTGNCQLTIVGCMNSLVYSSSNLRAQLKEVHKVAERKLLLCDVNEEVMVHIKEKLPTDWIHSEMPYRSSNGSKMVIGLINISK